MTIYREWDADSNAAARTPDSFAVRRKVIDLSIERSESLGNLLQWNQSGLFLRNAADKAAGGVDISLDVGASKTSLTNNRMFLSVGDAVNVPYTKVTVANKAQQNKVAYLESSNKIELRPQSITDLSDSGGVLDVRDTSGSGGVDLSAVGGVLGFGSDSVLRKDGVATYDKVSGERLFMQALRKSAILQNGGGTLFKNLQTFRDLQETFSFNNIPNDYYVNFGLTQANVQNLLGGNTNAERAYRVRIFVGIDGSTIETTGAQVVSAQIFPYLNSPAIEGEIKAVYEIGGEGSTSDSEVAIIDFPPFLRAPNYTPDMNISIFKNYGGLGAAINGTLGSEGFNCTTT